MSTCSHSFTDRGRAQNDGACICCLQDERDDLKARNLELIKAKDESWVVLEADNAGLLAVIVKALAISKSWGNSPGDQLEELLEPVVKAPHIGERLAKFLAGANEVVGVLQYIRERRAHKIGIPQRDLTGSEEELLALAKKHGIK